MKIEIVGVDDAEPGQDITRWVTSFQGRLRTEFERVLQDEAERTRRAWRWYGVLQPRTTDQPFRVDTGRLRQSVGNGITMTVSAKLSDEAMTKLKRMFGQGDEPALSTGPKDNSPALGGEHRLRRLAEQAVSIMSEQYPGSTRADLLLSVERICDNFRGINMPDSEEVDYWKPTSFFGRRMDCSVYDLHWGICLLIAEETSIFDGTRTRYQQKLSGFSKHDDPRSTERE